MQYAKRDAGPFFFEGWGAMGLLFVAALGITLALTGTNATANSLFQSPQSPVEGQAVPPAESSEPAPPPAPVDAAPPPQPAPAETTPDQAAPPAATPVEAPPPAGSEPQPAPADAGQPALNGDAPLPPPLPEPERRSSLDTPPPAGDDAQMVVDEAEFIDTVVVSFAYVWLCCGIVLILVIPLVFLFLHIRGRSKIIKEEQY